MVIPSPARGLITRYALCAFRALELRDIARIDFRLDQKQYPPYHRYQPSCRLSPCYSDLPILYRLNGGNYSKLVRIILKEALARYGVRLK